MCQQINTRVFQLNRNFEPRLQDLQSSARCPFEAVHIQMVASHRRNLIFAFVFRQSIPPQYQLVNRNKIYWDSYM